VKTQKIFRGFYPRTPAYRGGERYGRKGKWRTGRKGEERRSIGGRKGEEKGEGKGGEGIKREGRVRGIGPHSEILDPPLVVTDH
jgi:hypothetical protein